jgi:hypothetical protein
VVRPIFVDEVGRFNAALKEHHWLGHRLTGQVLRYVAVLDGEWVAVVGFGSAVLSCRARDEFLGWSREQQYAPPGSPRIPAEERGHCHAQQPAHGKTPTASTMRLPPGTRTQGQVPSPVPTCSWPESLTDRSDRPTP